MSATVLVALLASSLCAQQNARMTFSLDGPCGQTILGPPGSFYDDGTGGVPYFQEWDCTQQPCRLGYRMREGRTWDVVLTLEENPGHWVDTWSFGVGAEGALRVRDVTTDGTVSCAGAFPECLRNGGWDSTVLTGPPDGTGPQTEDNHGAISAVALNFQGGLVSLPSLEGRFPVCKLRVWGRFPESEGEVVEGRVFFATRIGSFGNACCGPIEPSVYASPGPGYVTIDHGDPPLELEECVVRLKATSVSAFVRCDANADGRLEISDAVRMLAQIFLGAEASCRAASDCNDDGERDISDPVWWLTYLFRRGPPPPGPFPGCGKIDIPVEECPPESAACP